MKRRISTCVKRSATTMESAREYSTDATSTSRTPTTSNALYAFAVTGMSVVPALTAKLAILVKTASSDPLKTERYALETAYVMMESMVVAGDIETQINLYQRMPDRKLKLMLAINKKTLFSR